MTRSVSITGSDAHGHVLLVYENQEERQRVLTEYFKEGLAQGELCVFVTPDPPEQVAQEFLTAGLDISSAIERRDLRIFRMTATYTPHGKFIADHMLTNVVNYTIDARQNGYTGLRTAGEMSWLYDQPEFLDGAAQYEKQVNELCDTSPEFTGLCLYPVRKDPLGILDSALQTHPNLIYDGSSRTSPLAATT